MRERMSPEGKSAVIDCMVDLLDSLYNYYSGYHEFDVNDVTINREIRSLLKCLEKEGRVEEGEEYNSWRLTEQEFKYRQQYKGRRMQERVTSTHKCEVIQIDKIERHPNADSLGLIKIYGYNVIVKLTDFKEGDLAAYVAPDSVVDTSRAEFAFLGEHKRITVKRFRGLFSQGLLVHAPTGSKVGDDVADSLGVARYEPPIEGEAGGQAELPPAGFYPKYKLEAFERYQDLLIPGEYVVCTEKLHGASSRFLWQNNRMYCGSRNEWKKPDEKCLWWRGLKDNPWIQQVCFNNPQHVLYGELYGPVQALKYGRKNTVGFAVFDIWDIKAGQFLAWDDLNYWDESKIQDGFFIERVPLVYFGEYQKDRIEAASNGKSLVIGADHLREGIVIQPLNERIDPSIGRVKLKCVNLEYLEKQK